MAGSRSKARARGADARFSTAGMPAVEVGRMVATGDILRYARDSDRQSPFVEDRPNFFFVTTSPNRDDPRLMLERGINGAAEITAPDGARRPVIAIRSSPWKAGHESNPWHDQFDLDHGHVRYYGDHKVTTMGLPGVTVGNGQLLKAYELHSGTSREQRVLAPPLLIFRSSTVYVEGRAVVKGYVEFCGAAVIERLEHVVQRDTKTGRSFPNLVFDLAVVDLAAHGDALDMRWIDDRRDPDLSSEEALRYAPPSWCRWVSRGRSSISQVRRRALSSRVRTREEQLPAPNTDSAATLAVVYQHFDRTKHAFEMLAAKVAAAAVGGRGGAYHEGWLTRAGGDGGLAFVARLDVGPPSVRTPLVVLGQAKCVSPDSSISADQVARVVARLRRGWVGVFVTTGTFSKQAQVEVIDDEYPLVLIPARELVEHVERIAAEDFDGDVPKLLAAVSDEYLGSVTHRRPQEVLAR